MSLNNSIKGFLVAALDDVAKHQGDFTRVVPHLAILADYLEDKEDEQRHDFRQLIQTVISIPPMVSSPYRPMACGTWWNVMGKDDGERLHLRWQVYCEAGQWAKVSTYIGWKGMQIVEDSKLLRHELEIIRFRLAVLLLGYNPVLLEAWHAVLSEDDQTAAMGLMLPVVQNTKLARETSYEEPKALRASCPDWDEI